MSLVVGFKMLSSYLLLVGSNSNILTAETMMKELQPVKKKWYIIGTELKFPARRLNIIKLEGRDSTDKCLASLCEQWVESSKEATWQEVVDALRSKLVDEKDLAETLEHWIENSNSKTWVRYVWPPADTRLRITHRSAWFIALMLVCI